MDDQELHKLVDDLHAEIQKTQSVDEKGQQLLRHLDADIRNLLEHAGKSVHPTTLDRFQESLEYFEITHPALSGLITRLMEVLSNAGI
jgi:hypothetical protein